MSTGKKNLLPLFVPNSCFRTIVTWVRSLEHETKTDLLSTQNRWECLKCDVFLCFWRDCLPICACVTAFRVTSNTAEFHLLLCQGIRAGFELESYFTYLEAGVISSMKRYVLNIYSYCCSLYVLCKHHVALGVYLALDLHTSVCSTQGFTSTTYGTFICQSVWKLHAKKRAVLPHYTITNFVTWDSASKYNLHV
jgi:hypothetical protein